MTPKEKAEELFDKFNLFIPMESSLNSTVEEVNRKCIIDHNATKKCALIAVDEILNSRPLDPNEADWDDCGGTHMYYFREQIEQAEKYWQEVKNEIEKL